MKVTNRTLRLSRAAVLLVTAAASYNPSSAWGASDAEFPPLVRVRSSNPFIVAVIDEAAERSTVFRRLIKQIEASDGLVYVDDGKCGHGVRACLILSVQVAGPHRLLRIVVNARPEKKACDLMASIGHELQHAIEVLGEPRVRDFHTAYAFYEREGSADRLTARFETAAALRTGFEVRDEVCAR
jgi:hypothetical protein